MTDSSSHEASKAPPRRVLVVAETGGILAATRAARLLGALREKGIEAQLVEEGSVPSGVIDRLTASLQKDALLENIVLCAPESMEENPYRPRGGKQYASPFARPKGRPRR